MNYPRLLVLSNNSFSKSNSNGRTLGSLLQKWPKDRIAQFCLSTDGADLDVCNNYFCVTDADVVRATIKLHACTSREVSSGNQINANKDACGHVKHYKTTLKMLARNALWMLGIWRGKEFYTWVESFKPDIVLLQSGESFFMHHLAMKIAKSTGAKLAVFNTEAYYFFNKDYFVADNSFSRRFLFPIYQKIYRHYFNKFMKQCQGQIYGNELLKTDYDNAFDSKNSIVVYTGSELVFSPTDINHEKPTFSYLGNMGFDRPKALIEFAKAINEINNRYILDVYGFAKNEKMEQELKACQSIRFHGAISYSQVLEVMKKSDFLIHVEHQSERWAESLRYGFSTKIADSISSGKIFILFSSPDIACAQYIQKNHAGIFASDINDLKAQIRQVINSADTKNEITKHAKAIAETNHKSDRNSPIISDFLASFLS